MTISTAKPSAEAIRAARLEKPKSMERELAGELGISEGEFVAAFCGASVVRIEPRLADLLPALGTLGEVMALTRNASAVHEKVGIYRNVTVGAHNALVLGGDIDLRIFPKHWVHAFAVEKTDGDTVKRSLQFFDASGEAVHKVHLRPASDVAAYEALIARFRSDDQSTRIAVKTLADEQPSNEAGDADALRSKWEKLTDTHQFFGMLRSLKLTRHQAVHMIGADLAWQVEVDGATTMMEGAAQAQVPIMCFIGSRGCIQIHSGPVQTIKAMGPWINVLDEGFHMHLRSDHITEVWVVRKPTSDGFVTSLEAYDSNGKLIIQYFGKRHEGEGELPAWRNLVESLPRLAQSQAA
ncbi:hemin-degrading factor [Tianweitania populi]|nr:ChuX/HutX family heme-like substrate-binding protein [Tianweitania populi]